MIYTFNEIAPVAKLNDGHLPINSKKILLDEIRSLISPKF